MPAESGTATNNEFDASSLVAMYADSLFREAPVWSKHSGRRLLVSCLMATICVAALLSALRLPVVGQAKPLTEIFVRILVEEVESIVVPLVVDEATKTPADSEQAAVPIKQSEVATDNAGETVDWYSEIPDAVAFALDNIEKTNTVNPAFDEKRRQAAAQFAPSKAEYEKPIWESVEKDTLGRSILVSGDCYRVIDDPNAGSREAFETFGQYIVMCMNWKKMPRELPSVNEIRNRRASQPRYGRPAAE